MIRCLRLVPLLVLASGCLPFELFNSSGQPTKPMPINSFGSAASTSKTVSANFAPASSELSLRVDYIGRSVLAANKSIQLNPLFATIGSPQPEVFHVGTGMVYLTDGLVKRCKTDGELAALICLELGKIVAEREAVAPPQARQPDYRPPLSVPIGNSGQFNTGDNVALAELAKHDREHPKPNKRLPPLEPRKLARNYLESAGFKTTDLDAAEPLLIAAERSFAVEKQFRDNPAPQTLWKSVDKEN